MNIFPVDPPFEEGAVINLPLVSLVRTNEYIEGRKEKKKETRKKRILKSILLFSERRLHSSTNCYYYSPLFFPSTLPGIARAPGPQPFSSICILTLGLLLFPPTIFLVVPPSVTVWFRIFFFPPFLIEFDNTFAGLPFFLSCGRFYSSP